jgi:hypothetical protein
MPLVSGAEEHANWFLNLSGDLESGNQLQLKGQTNLPVGLPLNIIIKGVYTAPYANYEQCLESDTCIVQASGIINTRIPLTQSNILNQGLILSPDYYEVDVYINAQAGKNFHLSADEMNRFRKSCYIDVFELSRLRQRQAQAQALLKQQINNLWLLDHELKEHIKSFEEVKKGDSEITRVILQAFGMNKTKEDVIQELVHNWFIWESDWHKKVHAALKELQASPAYCVYTIECLIDHLNDMQDIAVAYDETLRSQATEQRLPYSRRGLMTEAEKSVDFRQECLEKLERELLCKSVKDVMRLTEHLVTKYVTDTEELRTNASAVRWDLWKEILKRDKSYLEFLKEESAQYAAQGLFQSKGVLDESGFVEGYKRLQELIISVSELVQVMNRWVDEPVNKTYYYEATKIADNINSQLEEFFDIVQ